MRDIEEKINQFVKLTEYQGAYKDNTQWKFIEDDDHEMFVLKVLVAKCGYAFLFIK